MMHLLVSLRQSESWLSVCGCAMLIVRAIWLCLRPTWSDSCSVLNLITELYSLMGVSSAEIAAYSAATLVMRYGQVVTSSISCGWTVAPSRSESFAL